MNSRTLTFLAAIMLFAILSAPVRLSAQVRYTVTDVGTLGGSFVTPNTINNRGQITGISSLAGEAFSHAFFWEDGSITDLGTLGGPLSLGAGINESGEVVVGADTSLPDSLPNTVCSTGGSLSAECLSGATGSMLYPIWVHSTEAPIPESTIFFPLAGAPV
jgi:probable HAF family extracellular repeat protein